MREYSVLVFEKEPFLAELLEAKASLSMSWGTIHYQSIPSAISPHSTKNSRYEDMMSWYLTSWIGMQRIINVFARPPKLSRTLGSYALATGILHLAILRKV